VLDGHQQPSALRYEAWLRRSSSARSARSDTTWTTSTSCWTARTRLVTKVAGTQQWQGSRLEEIQQSLDLTVGRLDRFESRLDRIEGAQREQHEMLTTKLNGIVALLRGDRPASQATTSRPS